MQFLRLAVTLCCVVIRVSIISAITAGADIHIIGLSVVANASLSDAAGQAIQQADLIIGSARQLKLIDDECQRMASRPTQQVLPALSELKDLLADKQGKNIVVLASGDPLYYGIGRWFSNNFTANRLAFYPAVSSVQAACHALGLALQDVVVISLHGRPLEKIRTVLQANQTLLVLTDKHSSPQALAQECMRAGFEQSQLTVCENLAYPEQCIRHYSVSELLALNYLEVHPLHVTVIKTAGKGGVQPITPGILDHHYQTGKTAGTGMITKREVRLIVLSMMQVSNGDVIWDIGAGCGGVSVELARWNSHARVYAIEQNAGRLALLKNNSAHFGVSSNCFPVLGRAPSAFIDLPEPNKLFIGGNDGELTDLLPMLWDRLPLNGILMATAVTDQTKQALEQLCQSTGHMDIECVELAVGRGELGQTGFEFKRKRPVMVLKLLKTERVP